MLLTSHVLILVLKCQNWPHSFDQRIINGNYQLLTLTERL